MRKFLALATIFLCAPALAQQNVSPGGNGITTVTDGTNTFQPTILKFSGCTVSGSAVGTATAICSGGGGGGFPAGNTGDLQTNAGSGNFGAITPGTGVASALGQTLNGTGALSATTSPVFVTPTWTGAAVSGGIADSGGINTTSASGYEAGGATVINSLAQTTSPILSPETQNIPSPDAIYVGHPIVNGWNETYSTSSVNTYSSMTTNNLTVNGTVTGVHYGLSETYLNLLAGSGTPDLNGELNLTKTVVAVPSGVTVATGENWEDTFQNSGTLTQWTVHFAGGTNTSTGTMGHITGYSWGPVNNNTTASSFGAGGSVGFACQALAGSGSAIPTGWNVCLLAQDPKGEIQNWGHYRTKVAGGDSPTISSNCTLSSGANDESGTVTFGTSQTQCVVTFYNPYSGTPNVEINSPNGAFFTSYAPTTTTLTINTLAATGSQFTYRVAGT